VFNAGENTVWLSNSLNPNEMPSFSASHLSPSCLHMVLWFTLCKLNRLPLYFISFKNWK